MSNGVNLRESALDLRRQLTEAQAELAAIKAQEPVAEFFALDDGIGTIMAAWADGFEPVVGQMIYAAPVSEANEQGEYGDAYQGAREDLAIWKRRALEAEKALQEERIITERLGNALNEENGPTFMGAPVLPTKAQGVVQWPDADEIMQMAFEEGQPADDASGYCFELEEFDLFIERLMSEVVRLNAAPVQQVSVPDVSAMARVLADLNADACNVNREDNWAIYGQDYVDDVTAMLAALSAGKEDQDEHN